MVKSSKQSWEVGQSVKVGFLTLVVKAKVATPGDFKPDAYILANSAGTQLYAFVPHNGLSKIEPHEAREMIAEAKAHAERVTALAINKAKSDAAASAQIGAIAFS